MDDGRRPGDDIDRRELTYSPHEFLVVNQQEHEDQDEGQDDSVDDLGEDCDFDQGQVGVRDHSGAATIRMVYSQ